jgi:hypothetical protein
MLGAEVRAATLSDERFSGCIRMLTFLALARQMLANRLCPPDSHDHAARF